jgi:hypothetical protein
MKRILFFFFLSILCISVKAQSPAQDTLPKFSLRNVGMNRVIIGWVNKYERVSQISIQRGFDSLGAYRTILSVADPKAIQNGFADTKAPNDHMFYRIFIVFEGGSYFFTAAKRPKVDTARTATNPVVGDTAVTSTKEPEPEIKKPGWIPSAFVYTNKEGYVYLNLPDAAQKKYRVRFLEEDGTLLFEIKQVKESGLTLDKANFIHAGWFNFELYNDEKLVEKNKFYLAKLF